MKKLFKNDKKGFTLAELLIVVAIIAVLVAISIPIFTSQLEKSREATDEANIRAAYAEVMSAVLTEDTAATTNSSVYNLTVTKNTDGTIKGVSEVNLKQAKDGWQNTAIKNIAGIDVSSFTPKASGTCTVTYDGSKTPGSELTIVFN